MEELQDILVKISAEFHAARLQRDMPASEYEANRKAEIERMSIKHPDEWHKRLFMSVCESYDLRAFRQPVDDSRMTHVKAPPQFFKEAVWPAFMAHSAVVEKLIKRLMDIIADDAYPGQQEILMFDK